MTAAQPRRGATLAVVVSVGAAGVLPGFFVGALSLQIRRDLDMGLSGIGVAVAIFFMAAAVGSRPLGRVAERVGPSAAMRACAFGAALSLFAIGALARSPAALVALLGLAGVCNAISQPATNLFLTRRSRGEQQGLLFGIKQSAIPLAILVSGLAVPVAALTIGWRATFAVAGVLALAAAAAVPREPAVTTARATGAPGGRLDARLLGLLALAVGLSSLGPNSLPAHLVASGAEAGISEAASGLLLAAGSVMSLGVRVLAGWLSDRSGRHDFMPVAALLALGSLGFALIAFGRPALVVVGALLAFALGWGWNGLFHFAVVNSNRDAPAAATGVTQSGIYAGASLGPALFGLIAERISFGVAWATSASFMLIAALVLLLVARAARDAAASVAQ